MESAPPPKVYYTGVFGRILLTPTMLLDMGWAVVDGVWIAPPEPTLIKEWFEETQEQHDHA